MTIISKSTKNIKAPKADMQRLKRASQASVDVSDISEMTEQDFANARRVSRSAAKTTQRRDQVETYRDTNMKWRWRRVATNGQIVGASSQGYASKAACIENARRLTAPFEITEGA